MARKEKGFTLIELMIVVAIVAILAAIGISVYQDSIAKTQLSEAFTIADGLKTDVAEYEHQTGACPTAGIGGILAPASYSGNYVGSTKVSGTSGKCTITATMRNNTVASRLRGKIVTFTMDSSGGMSQWTCSSDAPTTYLPHVCR